nr:glycosyltransferase [Paenibacillus sp. Marseille-Q4541]
MNSSISSKTGKSPEQTTQGSSLYPRAQKTKKSRRKNKKQMNMEYEVGWASVSPLHQKEFIKLASEIPAEELLLSVIIPAMNEESTIANVVIESLGIHPSCEVIVIVNGSTDQTAERAEAAGAKVLHYHEPLGHDVGRRRGAEEAKGRVLLFVDGDMVIPSRQLQPFVHAVLSGVDIALNDYKGPVHRTPVHPVIEAKYALNIMLGRPDLQGASLTAVPNAISRLAYETIGPSVLEVPPLAQTIGVSKGLEVQAVHPIPVGHLNPSRRKSDTDPLTEIILSDHLVAIRWLTDERGPRAGYTDLYRDRQLLRMK